MSKPTNYTKRCEITIFHTNSQRLLIMLQRVKTRKWHKSVKIILNSLVCVWAKKLSQTKLVKKNETRYIPNKILLTYSLHGAESLMRS